jgi:putative phage-type endonuclease
MDTKNIDKNIMDTKLIEERELEPSNKLTILDIDPEILGSTNLELIKDIHDIISTFSDISINLSELVEYTFSTLSILYSPKVIYREFIKQIICFFVDEFRCFYNFPYRPRKNRVLYLSTLPQHVQKSKEWLESKKKTIGASENGSVFNMNPYSSRNQLLLKKLGVDVDKGKNFLMFTQHGILYEPVLNMIYEKRYETTLLEFGSIIHEKYDFISASPDGITPNGIMVEFKAPKSRALNGIPPAYYWTQMQQQLQVCRLDKCDFVECVIREYKNWDQFVDYSDEDNPGYSKWTGEEHGVILEFIKLGESVYDYVPLGLTPDKILEYQREKITEYNDRHFVRVICWYVEEWSNIPVWRDDEWWHTFALPELIKFWDEVKERRVKGYDDLIKPKKIKTPEYTYLSKNDTFDPLDLTPSSTPYGISNGLLIDLSDE